MIASFLNGDIKKARKIQLDAIELINALFCEVNPIPVKAALNMMGLNVGGYREPLVEMEQSNYSRLERAMKNYGLI
jgi:4-hydroxy-tetrahydrodipicolinate synthase